MVNDTKPETRKRIVRNYHLPPAKKMEESSSVKMTMVTLSADYCGTLNLQQPFFATDLSYFAKVLSFCMKMPDVTHPTGQLFMAVHLIGFGSVSILCSVFYLSLNP